MICPEIRQNLTIEPQEPHGYRLAALYISQFGLCRFQHLQASGMKYEHLANRSRASVSDALIRGSHLTGAATAQS
jgi:hypothetical protein